MGQDMCQSGFYFGFVEDPSLHDLFLYEFSCTIELDIMQERSVLDLRKRDEYCLVGSGEQLSFR